MQSLIYGTGHVLVRFITFLLLPVYTNLFVPEEYGIVSLAFAYMAFMNVVLKFGLDAALMKKYVQAKTDDRISFYTTAIGFFGGVSILYALINIFSASIMSKFILGIDDVQYWYYITAIICVDILWSIPQLILRTEEKPYPFLIFSFINAFGTLGLNIYLVAKLGMGVKGVLASNAIASSVLFLLTMPITWNRVNLKGFSTEKFKEMMRFGLPFLPSGIFAMTMEVADRYVLKYLGNANDVGLYSAGYKIGSLMLLLVMGFNMAWQPFFLRLGKDDMNVRQLFSHITTLLASVMIYVWLLMFFWIGDLVKVSIGSFSLLGPEYWSAIHIIPIIAFGYVLDAMYLVQLPGPFLMEKSKWIMIVRGVGAMVNLGLNFLLIPSYGYLGAAWATCLSFGIMAGFLFIVNRTLFPIPYEWRKLILIIITASIFFGIIFFITVSFWVKLFLSFTFPAVLFFLKIIDMSQFFKPTLKSPK
ncbi:MAG: oligosaccharide flippase family protein [Candidatus Marinimicrobia bacterium]|mgnify:CR=1 FL=1|jgi:O-antigen/teichoic acid export membrane protein|nr:oligosaccharide flippase family protein [Candidatus Neomarinimicrobiota bacterium]MBT3838984.1 oligosaccharide flippase family protein [Candidatus Neomarinimicrobiota bacterium]MBT3999341.1 oligosaccharide flippase family protein [Candidatus Neomarinimicrobiota bacterium]MBT4282707.1 oligosaccharide flippase family protein [Candidatus Neomarinimicrobiota bacterium]MBT4578271.1 oligosaccharide flippase family protein [Candidatus Neomarinimicrobiota bacterium]